MSILRTIKTTFWKLYYRYNPEPTRFTKEEVIEIARTHNLENEVLQALRHGLTPDEALQEWDIYPYNN